MLRSKFNKKKRGGSFMDAWNSGANDLKNNLKTLKNKSMEVAANTQEGITAFETSRKAQLQSRTMPGGLNPFKRRPKDHFARSGKPIGQREVLNPLNPQVQTEALSRQSAYDTAMLDFKKKTHQIAGKRKTKKRRRKRKRKTRRKRRGGIRLGPIGKQLPLSQNNPPKKGAKVRIDGEEGWTVIVPMSRAAKVCKTKEVTKSDFGYLCGGSSEKEVRYTNMTLRGLRGQMGFGGGRRKRRKSKRKTKRRRKKRKSRRRR
jgi:hypothetical protein